jgi:release factor glutamine methyltransferase
MADKSPSPRWRGEGRGEGQSEATSPATVPLVARGEAQTVRTALTAAAARLNTSDTPRLDAELLLAHALGITRERLLLTLADQFVPATFDALVERRARHEPVAYITGTRAFWTIDLHVAPGVLIPRPDSETLIEAGIDHFAGTPGPRSILDLGTGSGALLLAALDQWPAATGVGIDASPDALAIARANADRIAPGRARIVAGGWEGTGAAFDLILCNPPYIPADAQLMPDVSQHEPASALFAGADGLDDYRQIAPSLAVQIAPGGVACIEIGAEQRGAAGALFAARGLSVTCRADLAGRDRCLVVTP